MDMKKWNKEEIKELRVKLKLSQAKFGELVGTSDNYIYMLEKGVRNASKTLKILLGYIERELVKKEKGEGKHGKRHL